MTSSSRGSPSRRRRSAGRDVAAARELGLDVSLPVLHFKIGRYPIHHTIVDIIRSFGRAGVPVASNTEDRFTPAAVSRYLTRRILWSPDAFSDPAEVLEHLARIGREMGDKPVIVCTDDEAAILVAEGAETLREYFTLPAVPPELPRQLAGKQTLYELCLGKGFPSPHTAFPSSRAELEMLVDQVRFPVVVKNLDPWQRRTRPTVPASTIVQSAEELLERAADWQEPLALLIQEYLPEELSEDWIVQGYIGARSHVVFTARKLWAWPPFTGQTAYARLEENSELSRRALSLCEQIGYRGIFDIDFRLDRRNGTFYLLDFNPRVGAPFCLFENDLAIDVVRAMHLDLSGRPIPPGTQTNGLRLVVEPLALAAWSNYRRSRGPSRSAPVHGGPLVLAWFAKDDPLPIVAMALRQLGYSIRVRARLPGAARSRP